MSPARLELSDHAALRMKVRQITRMQIRRCVAIGRMVAIDVNGRAVKECRIRNRVLVVVYIEVTGGALIVTAFWRD